MKSLAKYMFILLVAVITATAAKAQYDNEDTNDINVPIDGGLSLLVAAGVAYGAKKGYDKSKKAGNVEDEVEK